MSHTKVGAFGAAALMLAAALSPARGETLRWKFKAGETLHYQMDQTTVTQVKAAGQEIKTSLNQVLETSWAVGKVNEDGSAEMSQSIDRIRTKIESAFGAFTFDSADEKAPTGPVASQVTPLLKSLVGAKFTYTIGPNGALSNVTVPPGLVEKLKQSGSTANSSGIFSEAGLKAMIVESSLELPKGEVEKGKAWTRQSRVASPPTGALVVDKTYTLLEPEQGTDPIGLDLKVTLEATPNASVELALGPQEGKGRFNFDRAAGRVVGSNVHQKVELRITTQGQTIQQMTDTTTAMKLMSVQTRAAK